MALVTFDVTFNGSAQNVATALGITQGKEADRPFRQLIVAADPANGNVCYIGAASTISSTSFGFALDPTQATAKDREVFGPFESTGPIKLSDIWVLGTNAEKVHFTGIPL
jgi:hypothetical protein